jgi:hypothetical protein
MLFPDVSQGVLHQRPDMETALSTTKPIFRLLLLMPGYYLSVPWPYYHFKR